MMQKITITKIELSYISIQSRLQSIQDERICVEEEEEI